MVKPLLFQKLISRFSAVIYHLTHRVTLFCPRHYLFFAVQLLVAHIFLVGKMQSVIFSFRQLIYDTTSEVRPIARCKQSQTSRRWSILAQFLNINLLKSKDLSVDEYLHCTRAGHFVAGFRRIAVGRHRVGALGKAGFALRVIRVWQRRYMIFLPHWVYPVGIHRGLHR